MFSWVGPVVALLSILSAAVSLVAARRVWRDAERKARIERAREAVERAREEVSRAQGRARGRLRAAEVRLFLAENDPLLKNEDLDFLVSSNLLQRATGLLVNISKDIGAINQDERYPLEDFQELMSAYNSLDEFVKRAFAFHEKKFGLPEEAATDEEAQATSASDEEAEEMASEAVATPIEEAISLRRQAESGVAQLRNGSAT